MAPSADRDKALDTALAQIDRQFGKGSVMRLGDDVRAPIEVIPTGSIALDIALGIGGLPRGRVVEIYGPESSGKCLTADTYVWTDRGLETVEELFDRVGQPASCTSRVTDVRDQGVRMVNEHGELETLAAVTHNNRKPVLRITVRSGRTVSVTHNHPLRVMSERGFIVWRKAGDLRPGDHLVSGLFGAVEAAAGEGLSEDEAVLLGYLVAEGSMRGRNAIRFTNWDPEVAAEYTALMEGLFGVTVRHYDDGKEHCVFDTSLREPLRRALRAGLRQRRGQDRAALRPHGRAQGPASLPVRAVRGRRLDRPQRRRWGWAVRPSSSCGRCSCCSSACGIPATVSANYNPIYEKDYWTVTVNPAVTHRFLAEVGFRSEAAAAAGRRELRGVRPRPAAGERAAHGRAAARPAGHLWRRPRVRPGRGRPLPDRHRPRVLASAPGQGGRVVRPAGRPALAELPRDGRAPALARNRAAHLRADRVHRGPRQAADVRRGPSRDAQLPGQRCPVAQHDRRPARDRQRAASRRDRGVHRRRARARPGVRREARRRHRRAAGVPARHR